MEEWHMKSFSNFNKFSQNVIKYVVLFSLLIITAGMILYNNYTFYKELFIARKLVETGVCLLPLSVTLAILTDYIYKKTIS